MTDFIRLKNGLSMPKLGMGTWYLGESQARHAQEVEALEAGLASGIRMIDTAEMYGDGRAEQLVGEVVKGAKREDLFLVSKIYPYNVRKSRFRQSLETTLRNMQTDYLDLYLLHWRDGTPLQDTVKYMEEAVAEGKIKAWGVSNFDVADMEDLLAIPGGDHCVVNQVLYHLGSRGIEYDLLPWLRDHNIAVMAYSPLAQAGSLRRGLLGSAAVQAVAKKHGISSMQVLLAFVLGQEGVVAIPRSGQKAHVLDNLAASKIQLDDEDLDLLDAAFPPPDHKMGLDII